MNQQNMIHIGAVSYSDLVDGKVKDWDVVNVFGDSSTKSGLKFEQIPDLPYHVQAKTDGLELIMDEVFEKLHEYHSPLFEEFEKIGDDIVTDLTYFLSDEAYIREGHGNDSHGSHYSQPKVGPTGGSWRGAYINLGPTFTLKCPATIQKAKTTLMHEWSHEMHLRSWVERKTHIHFNDYCDVMNEVFGIFSERFFGEDDYENNPHMEALELVEKLEQSPEFMGKPFHEQWKMLLKFQNERELERYINNLELKLGPTTHHAQHL
jgi:hypothetical protein